MAQHFFLNSLVNLMGWVSIIIAGFAASLAASYFRHSRWAGALAAGFTLEVAVQVATRVLIPFLVKSNPSGVGQITETYAALSVVGLVGQAALVLGVAGVLSDLRRAKRTP